MGGMIGNVFLGHEISASDCLSIHVRGIVDSSKQGKEKRMK